MHLFVLNTEMIKRSRGRYTDKQIKRCSQLGGAFGKEVDKIFQKSITEQQATGVGPKQANKTSNEDLEEFFDLYGPEGLFRYQPDRNPRHLPQTTPIGELKHPFLLGQFLLKASTNMEAWQTIRDRTRRLLEQ